MTPLPPEVEAEFRRDTLSRDAKAMAGLMALAIAFLAVSFPSNNYDELHGGALLGRLALVRGVNVAFGAAAIVLVRRAAKASAFDAIVTAWAGLIVAGAVIENAWHAPGDPSYVAWDVFLTMTIYAALPLPLTRQVILALLLSIGDIAVTWRYNTAVSVPALVDIALAYACANAVGFFVSWHVHQWRRREFVARTEATRALAEVRTLRGIIPICAYCKNIRTDAGSWERVEAYVRDHTDASFSHGVCPDCMRKHFPDDATAAG